MVTRTQRSLLVRIGPQVQEVLRPGAAGPRRPSLAAVTQATCRSSNSTGGGDLARALSRRCGRLSRFRAVHRAREGPPPPAGMTSTARAGAVARQAGHHPGDDPSASSTAPFDERRDCHSWAPYSATSWRAIFQPTKRSDDGGVRRLWPGDVDGSGLHRGRLGHPERTVRASPGGGLHRSQSTLWRLRRAATRLPPSGLRSGALSTMRLAAVLLWLWMDGRRQGGVGRRRGRQRGLPERPSRPAGAARAVPLQHPSRGRQQLRRGGGRPHVAHRPLHAGADAIWTARSCVQPGWPVKGCRLGRSWSGR